MKPEAHAAQAADAYLAVQDVRVTYPGSITALEDLSLQLGQGDFVSVVGPSGCGKSTLLKAVAGLVEVSAGTILVDGREATRERDRDMDLAFVFQSPTLLSWRTVTGNVRLPLELRHAYRASDRQRIDNVLEWVGLADFSQAYPSELSGGMQMRVSLARALVTRPHLLLLDEPFGALDDITRQRLNEDLLTIWLRDRWNALFVTHNVSEAVFLSERVLVMSPRPGRIVADIAIPLPCPRPTDLRTSRAFNDLVATVSHALHEAGGA